MNGFAEKGRVIRKIGPAISEGMDGRLLRGVGTQRVGVSDETRANRSAQNDGGRESSPLHSRETWATTRGFSF